MSEEKKQEMEKSPFAGCLIFLIAGVILLSTAGFAIYILFSQNREIDKFADSAAVPLPKIEVSDADISALQKRAEEFSKEVLEHKDEKHSLTLSVSDLNAALAKWDELKGMQPLFFIKEISDGKIIAAHTRQLNGLPGEGKIRYLNGTAYIKPAVDAHQLTFTIEKITDTRVPVAVQFVNSIPPFRVGDVEKYPAFHEVTSVEAKDGQLIIHATPGEVGITDKSVNQSVRRLIQVLLLGFMVIASIAVVTSIILKKKKDKLSS